MPSRQTQSLAFRTPSFSWRELVLLAAVVLMGVALRLVAFSRSAVEHFDEGVYASNIYFGPPDYAYPQQRFFAPPLLPALIEAGMIAGLPPNVAALLPSFLAGCATMVALWWFGRSWFGPRVGLVAAALAAASYFHIAYSTAALTDALLGLWLVLAIDAATRSLAALDIRWSIAAGIYTGLAWWTKYNGWLPLVIEAAAIPILFLLSIQGGIRNSRRLLKLLSSLALTFFVAAAVWAPYWWSLQTQGGYRPIAQNHARYFVGLRGWLDSASRQAANFSIIDAGWTTTALVIAGGGSAIWLACTLPRSVSQSRAILWPLTAAVLIILLTQCTNGLVCLVLLSLAGIATMLPSIVRGDPTAGDLPTLPAGAALVATWWAATFLATPLYWPYSRLLMPWLLAACIGLAILLDRVIWRPLLRQPSEMAKANDWAGVWILAAFAAIGLALNFLPLQHWRESATARSSALSADRLGLVRVGVKLRTDISAATESGAATTSDLTRVVYVMGEPAVLFQLRAAGEPIVIPTQNVATASATLDGRELPTFLVTGPHAQRDATFSKEWAAAKDHWKQIQSYDYSPSPIVWLDLHDPRIPDQPVAGADAIQLYRFQP